MSSCRRWTSPPAPARTIQGPPSEGGWHAFATFGSPNVLANPARNLYTRGDAGWFGWYSNPEVEGLVNAWIESSDEAERGRIFDQIQEIEFLDPPGVPLGKYYPWTAMSPRLEGFIPAPFTVFWNVRPV